jgi:DNA polymerase-3 subunit alpha
MQFVHLGIHTEFSITESIVRIPDLIKAAVNEEMPALALLIFPTYMLLLNSMVA